MTDLGSITPTLDVSTLKKKSSSVPSGDVIYPIPVPYYRQTPIPVVEEPNSPTVEGPSFPLPQLEPGDNLLISCRPQDKAKLNTPDPERKNLMHDIKDTIKNKGKELIHLMYNPHENEECVDQPDSPDGQEVSQKDLQTPEQIIDSLDGSAKFWIGKDYVNFIVKDFTNLDSPFDDFIDRVTTPRMPWHDVGVCVQGPAARDVSRHFIERWNATKLEKAKKNDMYPYLMPKSYEKYEMLPVNFPNLTHKVTCQVSIFFVSLFCFVTVRN